MVKERIKKAVYPLLAGAGVLGLNAMGADAGTTIGVMMGSAILEGAKGLFGELFGSSVDAQMQAFLNKADPKHPNEMNHDLHEALGNAMAMTFRNINILYKDQFGELPQMAIELAKIADIRFELAYKVENENVSQNALLRKVNIVLGKHKKVLGEEYLTFFQKTFSHQFKICFGEQLKTNPRAWIAFQREVYDNLNEQGRKILRKQNKILKELEAINNNENAKTPLLDQCLTDAIATFKTEFQKIINKLQEIKQTIDATHEVVKDTHEIAKEIKEGVDKLHAPHVVPKHLTAIPKHEGEIIGRDTQVAEIRKRFEGNQTQKQPVLLVNGIGGIGKSTVAMKYCADFAHAYTHIAWLRLTDAQHDNLRQSDLQSRSLPKAFADVVFLQNLDIPLDHGLDEEALLQNVVAKLCNLDPKVLLVIDNANNADEIKRYKPFLRATNADVLFTSRTSPEAWNSHEYLRIDQLPIDEALELFTEFYKLPADENALCAFLETKLHRHTLLMQLVAKVASARNTPFKELQAKYATLKLENRAIEAHIETTFQELSGLDDTHRNTLRIFTLLPPNRPISAELLAQLMQTEADPLETSLDALAEQGWLDLTKPETGGLCYAIHPLIHEVATRLLPLSLEETLPFVGQAAVLIYYSNVDKSHKLFEIAKNQDLAEFLLALPLLQNADAPEVAELKGRLAYLYENFGQYQISAELKEQALASDLRNFGELHPEVAIKQSNLALVYRDLGRYAEAADLLEQALASALRNFGTDHPTVAVLQSNLGEVYRNLGRYAEAAALLEQALASDLRNFGELHPTVAAHQSNLALVYRSLGRYVEAAGLLEQALASALRHFGEFHPNVAVLQSNLAIVYGNLGRYGEAAALLEKALASDLRNFGELHPEVAIKQSNLAAVYGNLGRYAEAADLLEQALASDLRNFGELHPTVAVSQSNLANVYRDLGRYAEAADLLKQALASDLRHFGELHPNVAVRQLSLAAVYGNLGRYADAADLLEEVLASDLRNFGELHPTVALSQSHLANVYRDLGRYAEAEALLEKALASDLRNFGELHPNVAVRQSNLAAVYGNLGRYAEAADLLEQALASDLRNFGELHPTVAVSQSNLANVYGILGRYAEAADLLEKALASALRNFGELHPTVAVSQSNLALVYFHLGRYADAADLLEEVLASALRNFGELHPTVAVSQSNLANVYGNLGRYADAADLLEQALASALRNFGAEHPNVAVLQSNLGEVYRNLGRYADAAGLLEQALASALRHFGELHPTVATCQNNLAHVYLATKRYNEAIGLWEAALANIERNFGTAHPHYESIAAMLQKAREMARVAGG